MEKGSLFPETGPGFKVLRLDSYGSECILTTEALASWAGATLDAIEQAIADGELPRPFGLLGRRCFMVGQLVDFIESRAIGGKE